MRIPMIIKLLKFIEVFFDFWLNSSHFTTVLFINVAFINNATITVSEFFARM